LRLLKPICLKFIVMQSQILHRFTFCLALILSVRPAFSLKKNGKLLIRCLWMLNDNLKLNDDKTEFLIIGTPQQLEKVDIMSICMGNSDIHPVPTARNPSSWFDSWLSMSKHIQRSSLRFFLFPFLQHTTHQQLSLTKINQDNYSCFHIQLS